MKETENRSDYKRIPPFLLYLLLSTSAAGFLQIYSDPRVVANLCRPVTLWEMSSRRGDTKSVELHLD